MVVVESIVNRKGKLSSSLSSIAMAGLEADRQSRREGFLVFLAMPVSGIGIVDAMITVSLCLTWES